MEVGMSQSSSSERTEKASSKKKKEARQKGNVFKSAELSTAVSVLALFGFLNYVWEDFVLSITQLMTRYLSAGYVVQYAEDINVATVKSLYYHVLLDCAGFFLPVFLVAVLTGMLTNVLQTGFLFTTKPLAFDLSKISPISGFKRIFSIRTVAELIKSILKASVLGYIVYKEYIKLMKSFPMMMREDIKPAFLKIISTSFSIALKLGLALAIIALADYLYQWWKYEKDLKMTKQEVKDESKQTEGDPQIKSKRRQKQRQMSNARMMQRVPEADVVITNPTHYAVALRYKEGVDKAPLILAKGKDLIAEKIKSVARENKIEIVENKPVAQAIYFSCEIGDSIPQEMYQAIADILVYVYKLKNKTKGARR